MSFLQSKVQTIYKHIERELETSRIKIIWNILQQLVRTRKRKKLIEEWLEMIPDSCVSQHGKVSALELLQSVIE